MSKRSLILAGAAILLFIAAIFSVYYENKPKDEETEVFEDEFIEVEPIKPRQAKGKEKKGAVVTSENETLKPETDAETIEE